MTRRRGLPREPKLALRRHGRRVGLAGSSGLALRPQLTVRSRREAGECLESSWFALLLVSGCPCEAGRRLPASEGCSGLRSVPGLGRRRLCASTAQFAPCAALRDSLPSRELPAEHTAPLRPVQGLADGDSQKNLLAGDSGDMMSC